MKYLIVVDAQEDLPAPEIKEKIDKRHKQNLFKLMPMAQYKMEE